MMALMETIRAYLGWCPMAGSMRMDLPVRYAATAAPGGQDGRLRVEPGWWNRYHNQILVAALAASAATVILFLLIEETPKYWAMLGGPGFGVGWAIGFFFSHKKQYARVTAGEFRRENMGRRLRIIRDLSVPVAFIILVVVLAYLVQNGMVGQILGIMLGLSLVGWATYGITLFWERRHRTILIAEKGSMYTLDTTAEGECA